MLDKKWALSFFFKKVFQKQLFQTFLHIIIVKIKFLFSLHTTKKEMELIMNLTINQKQHNGIKIAENSLFISMRKNSWELAYPCVDFGTDRESLERRRLRC